MLLLLLFVGLHMKQEKLFSRMSTAVAILAKLPEAQRMMVLCSLPVHPAILLFAGRSIIDGQANCMNNFPGLTIVSITMVSKLAQ